MQLSKRQVASLRRVWSDLTLELDVGDILETDDAACRDGLDSWLAGVISSDGRVDDSALENLLDLEQEIIRLQSNSSRLREEDLDAQDLPRPDSAVAAQ